MKEDASMNNQSQDIYIGHEGDAVDLLDEMLEVCEGFNSNGIGYIEWWKVRLEALKDAIERGIV